MLAAVLSELSCVVFGGTMFAGLHETCNVFAEILTWAVAVLAVLSVLAGSHVPVAAVLGAVLAGLVAT